MLKRAVLTCGDASAALEGVPLVALLAPAHGIVADHLALRVGAARTRARVTALLTESNICFTTMLRILIYLLVYWLSDL